MKVSIITATFNSARTVLDTIQSLESQTYSDIEYIIVDGNSSDNTIELIKQNSSKVNVLISEPDLGIYDALNKGIEAASGDVIGFLHSDDLFAYPDAVADIVGTFEANQCDSVYADLNYVSKDDTSKIIRHWKSGEYDLSKLKSGWMPPHPTFYMKREAYESLGCFDLSFKIAADYDSLLRYLWKGKISSAYLPKVIMNMRVGGASNRSFANVMQKSKEDIQALRNAGLFWPLALIWKNLSKIPQFIMK